MIKKFEKTGSFAVKSGRGRKSVAFTSVEDVATALQKEPSNGVQIARSLDMPVKRFTQYPALLSIQNNPWSGVSPC
ncbi:hypothetical protein CEXT_24261 [Caerostris extrusa]|uniref:Uncharacterized protein n=1 Tax=Caerostris extrusa TaxID=172846 RepID=A0AAV4PS14_CAEEX|nr:hypothetical protein CEXT_24261 [Caerostris extrusa]